MNALQKYINNDYTLINSYLRGNIETLTDLEIYNSKKLIYDLELYFSNNKINNKYKFRVYRGIRNKKNKKYDFYTNIQKTYICASFSERIALNNYTNEGGFLLIIDITPDIPYIIVDQFIKEYNNYDEDEDELLLPKGIKLVPTKIIDKNDLDNEYGFFGITIVYCNVTM
jgi:hypothetical protein